MFLIESRQIDLLISTKLTLTVSPFTVQTHPSTAIRICRDEGKGELNITTDSRSSYMYFKARHFHSMKISRFCAFEYVIREIKMSPEILFSAQLQN